MIYLAWVLLCYIFLINVVSYSNDKGYKPDIFRKTVYFASIIYIVQHYFGW